MPLIKKALLYSTLLLSLVCISLLSLPAYSSTPLKLPVKPTTVKLQLFWHHQFEFAGFYAAIKQGYFKKYNIKVELLEYEPKLDSISVVLNEKAQFGLADNNLIESYHQGKGVKLLASYFKQSPLTIITHPEITSLKQLVNKQIYGTNDQLRQPGIRGMLNLYDVDSAKINLMMTGDALALFKNKKIAGILAYRTNIPYILNQQNTPYRMYDPNQFGIASQDLNLFTTASFAKENPTLVKNFTLAANEGWRYAIKHPDELIKLIKSKYNTQNLTKDALKFEANETIKLISAELFTVGLVQKNKLASISEESFESKEISKIRNLDDFILQPVEERRIDTELFNLLTAKEKEYLNKNSVLKVQNESNYPPFNYSVNGKAAGYSIDYINVLAKKMGVTIQFIQNKSWQNYLEMLKNDQLDAMVNIMETPQRKEFYNFTTPFAEPNNVAVTRDNDIDNIINEHSIKSKKLVVVEGYAASDKYKKLYPSMTRIKVNNALAALKTITTKDADIFISNDAVINFYIEKHFITGLKLVPLSEELAYPNTLLSIATNITNPTLMHIFQKAMSTVAEHEVLALRKRWSTEIQHNNKTIINLTELERKYLRDKPIIKIQNDGNYPPFNYIIDGRPNGYSIDLMNKISGMLGVSLEYITNKEWSEYLTMLEKKELDMMVNIIETKNRRSFARFTSPYAEIATMAVTRRNEVNATITKEYLKDKRIVITTGYAVNESLKQTLPNNTFIKVNDTSEALKLISLNEADIYFESGAVVDYYITKGFMSDLQIISIPSTFEIPNQNFSLATHKNNSVLLGILQKALNVISEAEQIRLRRKWFGQYTTNDKFKIQLSINELSLLKNREIIWCLYPDTMVWIELIPYLVNVVDMKIVKSDKRTWDGALKGLENGSCDFLPEVTPTESRKKTMSFTPSIHKEARVIVTTDEHKFISNIEDYLEKTFTVLKGDLIVEQLKSSYPNIKLKLVENVLNGFQLVQKGQVFAHITSISAASNIISQYALNNLKISGSLTDKFMDHWTIATRKEDVLLSSIFSKIILSIDKKELRKRLFDTYSIKYEQGFDYTLFWQMLFIVFAILTAIIFWNRRLAALNNQLKLSKKVAEEAQQKVESQNSEILATQQQLVHSEKMASLGTLTAGVAHEINNPTNFAHAAVFMMQNEIDEIKFFLKQLAGGESADIEVIDSFDAKFEKLIGLTKTASEGTQRIKIIVEDLRTFARLDDSKQAKVKVSELITSTVHLVQTQYENITIKIDFAYDPVLLCFPSKLNQVFMNIIVNACHSIKTKIKHNNQLNFNDEPDGLINISTCEHENYIVIHVKDNGCGMDKQTQQKVCEPFFTTKGVGSGTGLGMAISFGIIEEHGGMLKISSILSQGSDFSIYLPVENNSSDNEN